MRELSIGAGFGLAYAISKRKRILTVSWCGEWPASWWIVLLTTALHSQALAGKSLENTRTIQ
ncbi:hypothetical protein PM082_012480 [Marasmius tenuissimus]|nr:hypothetical protein PM082_012480 [Marasmius tenuissimus]